jgi:hypothetical protein
LRRTNAAREGEDASLARPDIHGLAAFRPIGLDWESRFRVATVDGEVRRSGRDDHHLAGRRNADVSADPDSEDSVEDLAAPRTSDPQPGGPAPNLRSDGSAFVPSPRKTAVP